MINNDDLQKLQKQMGQNIRTIRLLKNLSQQYCADLSGMSLHAFNNLESGTGAKIITLLRVIVLFNRQDWLESLTPTISVNPLDMVRNRDRKRSRKKAYTSIALKNSLSRRRRAIKKYGLTIEKYIQMHREQDGKCGNKKCGKEIDLTASSTHVDHCHETGKVRSLLCNNCNSALGMIKEDNERAIGLSDYIQKHSKNK